MNNFDAFLPVTPTPTTTIEGVRLTDDDAWIQTYSGQPFWPLNPLPQEVYLVDIAWALSMQCRYAGHTHRFYSVAEHSVLLSHSVPTEYALWALLHDASEAYLTDIPRPIKAYLIGYKQFETRLMVCIAERFGLIGSEPASVKEADTRILHNERAALLGECARDWKLSGEPLPGIEIKAWLPQQAFEAFVRRFDELCPTSALVWPSPSVLSIPTLPQS